ncbi:type IX secretion system outer membrane channel protein PorV [soil metagenome]
MYRIRLLRQGLVAATALGLIVSIANQFPTAQAQVGQASALFLQIEPDSRATGMGGAGVAIADNATAIFWNPGGLAFQEGIEVSLTHSPYLSSLDAGLFYDFLAASYNIPGIGTFAGHLTYLNLGEQEHRDPNNILIDTFRSYELAVGASYARPITSRLGLGGGIRLIYSSIATGIDVEGTNTEAGVTFGVDLGLLYRAPSLNLGGIQVEPSLGFNLANMGPAIKYSSDPNSFGDPIPTTLRFGGALSSNLDQFNRITWALDFGKGIIDRNDDGSPRAFPQTLFSSWRAREVDLNPNDTPENTPCTEDPTCEVVSAFRQLTIGTGLEYWYNNLFALRTGYYYEDPFNGNRQLLTFGAGVRYSVVGIDFSYIYALDEQSPVADTMRFSILLNLNR